MPPLCPYSGSHPGWPGAGWKFKFSGPISDVLQQDLGTQDLAIHVCVCFTVVKHNIYHHSHSQVCNSPWGTFLTILCLWKHQSPADTSVFSTSLSPGSHHSLSCLRGLTAPSASQKWDHETSPSFPWSCFPQHHVLKMNPCRSIYQ